VRTKWAYPLASSNNARLLSDINRLEDQRILNIHQEKRSLADMKHFLIPIIAATGLGLAALPAQAAGCYADYKAKQENPLRLHYGVAQVSGECSRAAAQAELAQRLAANGWTLLTIVSVFGDEGLNQRKESAGSNFLRF